MARRYDQPLSARFNKPDHDLILDKARRADVSTSHILRVLVKRQLQAEAEASR